MRIAIVNAPSRARVYGPLTDLAAIELPVWGAILAAYLGKLGHDVTLVDAEMEGWTAGETAACVEELRPDLAVFPVYGQQPSASTQCLPGAERVARLLTCPTLCFGTHPSALPERTLREGPWTYVAEGEGHRTIAVLLAAKDGVNATMVPGLYSRLGPTAIMVPGRHNDPGIVGDLDVELPSRGFLRFDFRRYRAHNWHAFGYASRSPYASLQTSLGCPFRCSFCCINAPFGGSGIRFWSAENVLEHFRQLAERGVTHVKVPDEMFLLNPLHVEAICDGLIEMRGWAFNIWAYARVDTCVDDRLLAKLKRAGFNWLGIGIESASEHVRDGVEKGRFGAEDIVASVKRVRAHGIAVGANYIFGLPDDTRATMQETLDLACELNTEWANFYCAMAYPGSALYGEAKKLGWPLPDDAGGPGWIGYAQHAYETLPLPTVTMSAAEVLAFRDAAFHEYFERPTYWSMLVRKFGQNAVRDVHAMTAHRLKRKLLENKEITT